MSRKDNTVAKRNSALGWC